MGRAMGRMIIATAKATTETSRKDLIVPSEGCARIFYPSRQIQSQTNLVSAKAREETPQRTRRRSWR